jgi:hypothetical protein
MRIHSRRIAHEFIGTPMHESKSMHWTIIFDDGELSPKEFLKFKRTEVHQHHDLSTSGYCHHYFKGCRTTNFRPEHTTDKSKKKIIQMITDFLLANDQPLVVSFKTPRQPTK